MSHSHSEEAESPTLPANLERVAALVRILETSSLSELRYEDADLAVKLSRHVRHGPPPAFVGPWVSSGASIAPVSFAPATTGGGSGHLAELGPARGASAGAPGDAAHERAGSTSFPWAQFESAYPGSIHPPSMPFGSMHPGSMRPGSAHPGSMQPGSVPSGSGYAVLHPGPSLGPNLGSSALGMAPSSATPSTPTSPSGAAPQSVPPPPATTGPGPSVAAPGSLLTPAAALPEPAESKDLHMTRSPFVGTFYRSPSPNDPPFVEVGQRVTRGQTLCIVEAMKLMNEIESEIDGTILEVLVENAKPVQYGEPLFKISRGKSA